MKVEMKSCILPVFFLCNTVVVVLAEYYTSSGHLNNLLQKELDLRNQLKQYIYKKESTLARLKKFYMKTQDTEKYVSSSNVTLYAGHPLYIYSCIKRWHKDWRRIKTFANEKEPFLSSFSALKEEFPKDDDVSGATSAIIRLQETFALSSRQIIHGLETGAGTTPKLDVIDAYQLGYMAFRKFSPDISIEWMMEVIRLLDEIKQSDMHKYNFTMTKARFQAYDILAWAEHQKNNILASYNYTVYLLKLEPNNERIKGNMEYILEEIAEKNITISNTQQQQQQQKEQNKDGGEAVQRGGEEEQGEEERRYRKSYNGFYYTADEDEGKRYLGEHARVNLLCRGETDPIPVEHMKYLECWYKRDHPILILKPAKIERLYAKPELLMFRDAVSESEMRDIKQLAGPMLQRATVANPATGKFEPASYRISKSAWIGRDDDADLLEKMNRRIAAYTGLDMAYSEELQIANYGIGGFYESHFDMARNVPLRPPPWKKRDDYTRQKITSQHVPNTEAGERIATFLIYMTDVTSGGATVFTNIGQAVKPSKGDAVFWFNLMHDGSGDYLTRHAACPVLIGEKWVCNRWLHEYGQEFRRRCKLRHDDDWWTTSNNAG